VVVEELVVVVVVVVVEEEVWDGGRSVVALDKAVTEDFARAWPPGLLGPVVAPDATRAREVGTPEDVVGRTAEGALVSAPDAAGRVEMDDWRVEGARVRRRLGGGDAPGPGLSFSRWRVEADVVMRVKTPDNGRLLLAVLLAVPVPALVVALLVVRVAAGAVVEVCACPACPACPLTGSLLLGDGDTLRLLSPLAPAVSVLVLGLRRERVRDNNALVGMEDDMTMVFLCPIVA
jgi:hypothetical protein